MAVFATDEVDLIMTLAGCTLRTPGAKENWVDKVEGLPDYICRIARAILRDGKATKSEAISIAVSRVKVWASGKGVDKDTQAKAAAALAEWEEKRGESKAKTAAEHAGKDTVKASRYVEVPVPSISDSELRRLMDLHGPCPKSAVETLIQLSAPAPARSALELLLAKSDPDNDGDDDSSASGDSDKDSKDYANTKASNYADPGYQSDRKKRYALDSEGQVRAAWNYINQKDNAAKYSPGDLAKVKAAIKRAGAKYDITFND